MEDLEEIQATVSGIRVYDPMIMAGSREVVYQGNSSNVRVLGHSERHEEVWDRGVSRGAFFGEAEVRSSARVALVGETLVREVFQGADPIGLQIRVGTIPFEVIGVLDSMGIDPHGWDRDNEVIIPITTMMRRVMNVDYVQSAKFLAETGYRPGRDGPRHREAPSRASRLGCWRTQRLQHDHPRSGPGDGGIDEPDLHPLSPPACRCFPAHRWDGGGQSHAHGSERATE